MAGKIPLVIAAILVPALSCATAAGVGDVRFTFRGADPVIFSHASHLSHYSNCKMCHDALFNLKERRHHTMAEMKKGKSCGACHSGIKAFSVASDKECVLCHRGKMRTITFRARGAGEATFSHAAHLAATKGACRSCHASRVITDRGRARSMAEMEQGQSCGACHNGTRSFAVSGNCERCHRGMKPNEVTFKLKGVAPAVFSHSFHTRSFSCRECHTRLFPYRAIAGKATMHDMAEKKSCGACHNGRGAFTSAGNCQKCHPAFKPGTIAFTSDAGEAPFSHESHTQNYTCSDCHTKLFPYQRGTQKTTMAEMEKGASCGACHNRGKDAFPVQDDCDRCHRM